MNIEQIRSSLLEIASVDCEHHHKRNAGEQEECQECLLRIGIYDNYCLADNIFDEDGILVREINAIPMEDK